MPERLSPATAASDWTVVCLCADWCGTCREYRDAFATRAREREEVHVWIDIEDDSEWLGELDVETLPTLLVLHGGRPQFLGPVLPHIELVDRTLRALRANGPGAAAVPIAQADAVARIVEAVQRI